MTPERPSEVESSLVETRLGPVGVVDEGTGPPLVLIHGLPGSVRDYRWFVPALEADWRVVRIDLPGFGKTPLSVQPLPTVHARASVVSAVLDALELRDVVVAGHSMGGPVASLVAALLPERVRGLALIASVGVQPHRVRRRTPAVPISLALRVPGVRGLLLPRLRRAMEEGGFKGHTDTALVQTLHAVAATSFSDHERTLKRVRVSTLVAWASDDPHIEPEIFDQLYWRAPHGPRIRFPDGGHNIQKTRAVELAAAMKAWMAQLAEPAD